MIEDDELFKIASTFRDAIENAKLDGKFTHDCRFKIFPCGCCDDSAVLLSEYLKLLGIECKIVEGTYYDDDPEITSSHGWIEMPDGRIVDITGDQYKYNPVTKFSEPVYVGTCTEFHKMFSENMFTESQGIQGEIVRRNRLLKLYNIICEYLEKNNV